MAVSYYRSDNQKINYVNIKSIITYIIRINQLTLISLTKVTKGVFFDSKKLYLDKFIFPYISLLRNNLN